VLRAKDPGVTLARGNGSPDDPVLGGGSLRIVSSSGGFDLEYDLPASRWKHLRRAGAGKGYRFRKLSPIRSIVVKPGKLVKIVAKGPELIHPLNVDPGSVGVILRIGDHRYCFEFGGEVSFTAGRLFRAKSAPAPVACPLDPAP
jgi:hypothetical protein